MVFLAFNSTRLAVGGRLLSSRSLACLRSGPMKALPSSIDIHSSQSEKLESGQYWFQLCLQLQMENSLNLVILAIPGISPLLPPQIHKLIILQPYKQEKIEIANAEMELEMGTRNQSVQLLLMKLEMDTRNQEAQLLLIEAIKQNHLQLQCSPSSGVRLADIFSTRLAFFSSTSLQMLPTFSIQLWKAFPSQSKLPFSHDLSFYGHALVSSLIEMQKLESFSIMQANTLPFSL